MPRQPTPAELLDALRRPQAYPHPPKHVEVVQTHASIVFLAGDEVFKIKKPVDFGFLDYSSREKRRHWCEEEVRLNRELAPEVYRGVVPITRADDGELKIDGAGDVVEYAVHMRRLPDAATCAARFQRGALTHSHMIAVAGFVQRFHASSRGQDRVRELAAFDSLVRASRDNFSSLRDLVSTGLSGKHINRLEQRTLRELDARKEAYEARLARGLAVDGHGDLRMDHVYLLDDLVKPVIIDRIEFNDAFRCSDPLLDLAFLAMDLRAHGAWVLAHHLIETYLERSGDESGRELLPLFVAYRATVRAKVAGLVCQAETLPDADKQAARIRARARLALALGELCPADQRSSLVLVSGLPGTGKTTVAKALAERAGFEHIRSDVFRKRLAGLDPNQDAATEIDQGIYSPEWTQRTYRACAELSESLLSEGRRALVDATFLSRDQRQSFAEIARRWGAPFVRIHCEAPPEVTRARIEARHEDASDANWTTHLVARERLEPRGPNEDEACPIDTSDSVEVTLRAALRACSIVGASKAPQ